MEDEVLETLDGKNLGNLRVVDLKHELEKRGLSKSGSKKDLVKRLKQQLEFEKISGERKLVGECELKLELDADTEQNEFVQQYLAQQQKIYAEQREVKRLVELQEGQKSSDDKDNNSPEENCPSDQESESVENSENESHIDKGNADICFPSSCDDVTNSDNESLKVQIDQEKAKISTTTDDEQSFASPSLKLKISKKTNKLSSKVLSDSGEVGHDKSAKGEVLEKNLDISLTNLDDGRKGDVEASVVRIEEGAEEISLPVIIAKKDSDYESLKENSSNGKDEEIKSIQGDDNDESIIKSNKEIKKISPLRISSEKPMTSSGQHFKEKREMNSKNSVYQELSHGNDSRMETTKENVAFALKNVKFREENKDNKLEVESGFITLKCRMDQTSNQEILQKAPNVQNVGYCSNLKNNSDESLKTSEDSSENSHVGLSTSESIQSNSETVESMEIPSVPDYISKRKIVLTGRKMVEKSDPDSKSKRSKWGRFSNSQKMHQANITSTDSLKLDSKTQQTEKQQKIDAPGIDTNIELPDDKKSIDKRDQEFPKRKDALNQESFIEKNCKNTVESKEKADASFPIDGDVGAESNNKSSDVEKENMDLSVKNQEHNADNTRRIKTETNSASDSDNEESSKDASSISVIIKEKLERNSAHVSNVKDDDSPKIGFDNMKVEETVTVHNKCDKRSSIKVSKEADEIRSLAVSQEQMDRGTLVDKDTNLSRIKTDNKKTEISETNAVGSDCSDDKKSKIKNSTESIRIVSNDKKSRDRKKDRMDGEQIDFKQSSNIQPVKKVKTHENKSYGILISAIDSSQSSGAMLPPSVSMESNKAETTEPMEVPSVPTYVSKRKIVLTSRKIVERTEDDNKIKKSKWGNFSNSQKMHQAISISTDSLKNWFPDLKLLRNPEPSEMICEDIPPPIKEESIPDTLPSRMDEDAEPPVNEGESGMTSNILFIQNLVRPFTLLQLKELLQETGHIADFWIDKIKSKCCVTYETEEEAIRTRSALNKTRWPSSNPKILSVEFATEEELNFHKNGGDLPKLLPPLPPSETVERSEHRRKDEERRRPMREWDKDKVTQESPVREPKNLEKTKTSDKREKKEGKRRTAEDTPAKLLDDLFQKTKSSPCIYWLPLTEQQVLEREETKRQRKQERERRNQALEETEEKNKRPQPNRRTRDVENRRSSTRSRSPVSRRR